MDHFRLIIKKVYLTIYKFNANCLILDSGQPPSALFVYESCYPSHIENIYKFKEFLEENCYISPKLDLIEIPKTDSKVRRRFSSFCGFT